MMPQNPPSVQDPEETLRSLRQSLDSESLSHREAIFNAFSLTLTGLMAILAGVLAIGHMQIHLKVSVTIAVLIVMFTMLMYLAGQRSKSNEAIQIITKIDEQLKLFTPDVYIAGKPVLPQRWLTRWKKVENLLDDPEVSDTKRQFSSLFSCTDITLKLTLLVFSLVLTVILAILPDS